MIDNVSNNNYHHHIGFFNYNTELFIFQMKKFIIFTAIIIIIQCRTDWDREEREREIEREE